MVEPVTLSSLRNGRYLLRASCTRGVECNSISEIDINQAIESFGDITLTGVASKLPLPKMQRSGCNNSHLDEMTRERSSRVLDGKSDYAFESFSSVVETDVAIEFALCRAFDEF
jgi:hypothetical protein